MDTPYYRFRYDPCLEVRCISEFHNLFKRLKVKGVSSEIIWMNEWLLDALKKIDTLDNLIRHEKESKQQVFNTLSNLNQGLPKVIAERLASHLNGKDLSYCTIIFRIGSLFPFVAPSTLLAMIENKVKCMVIIPYPEKDGKMLGYKEEPITNYSRGELI